MEIGSVREQIIIALLISQFGIDNIETDIAITQNEVDVLVFDKPISIKTITNNKPSSVKVIWTVDSNKVIEFIDNYKVECDMLYIHINWDGEGGLYLFTKKAQEDVLDTLTINRYFKLPKLGTNSRGIELSKDAINYLIQNELTMSIPVTWSREDITDHKTYSRWLELWKEK